MLLYTRPCYGYPGTGARHWLRRDKTAVERSPTAANVAADTAATDKL